MGWGECNQNREAVETFRVIMTAALPVVIASFMSCVSDLKTLLASSWSPFLYSQGMNPELSMSQASTWGVH